MRRLLTLLILVMLGGGSAQAQLADPLVGPLVATTPARQDAIHLHDLSNGNTRTLTFGPGEHHVWDFSPDGCRILFTRDASPDGLPRLYTADLDGDNVQTMVTYADQPANEWGIWEPDWSANGLIAFNLIIDAPLDDDTQRREHYTAYIDPAEAPAPVEFYSVTGREYTPVWSPDGAWLAYVSYDPRAPGADVFSTAVPTADGATPIAPFDEATLLEEADLWVVSADGETKYRLTNFSTGSVRSPRWSPDGTLIGFIYSPGANNDTFWMIGNRAGAIPTQLSFDWNLTLDHTWMPDGSAMIASVRDFRDVIENRLWQIPLVGNADLDATLFVDDPNFVHTDFPRFSPDGRYLAFRNVYALTVIDRQANTWQRFDENTPGNTPPIWSPAAFNGEETCG
jgi:Tol biopolymer transport system component